MKNILYIAYDGMTDPLGQSQVLPYISGLSKLGFQFTLISCEKPERDTQENRALIQSICDAHNIDWHPLVYTKKPPVLSTLKDIRNIKKKAFALHRQKQFSLVHCRSYIPAMVGLQLKQKFGVKFLFDMRGFWADERVDGNIWKLSNPIFKGIYKYFKRKELAFFKHADHVISLTENGKQEIHSWKGITNNPRPITVIPCCADMDLFNYAAVQKQEIEKQKKALGIPAEAQVVSYLGSVGTWYMADEMLDFFVVYKKRHPDAVFLFITPDAKEYIHRLCAAKDIDLNSVFVKRAQRNEVPALASISTFSLFFIKPAYSKKASSPTKQGELMGLGIPIVCNSGVGDTAEIVRKYKSGVVVDAFNDLAYEAAIAEIEKLNFEAETLRAGALDYFDLELGVQRYAGVYKELIGE
jgi:glycosyltransferase involved in cell wall biosynthesis